MSKLYVFFTLSVAAFVYILVPLAANAALTDAWVLGDGEKVFRYDTDHPDRHSNSVWDGESVTLRGLYNEVLAFQVIAVADSEGTEAVEISVSAPLNRKSGVAIGGSMPLHYGPGGTIEVFSQHYIHVKRATLPNWEYEKQAAPEKMTGWIPDALIPADAKPGTGALPLDIPPTARSVSRRWNDIEVTERAASQNQGFWVDLHLPRDQKAYPAGVCEGRIEVWEGGRLFKSIPYKVELLPAYLPDENHSEVWMFTEDVDDYFPGLDREQIVRMIKFECHRHRIDAVGGFPAHRSAFDQERMAAYKPWLDGSGFSPAAGYRGPGQGTGEKVFPVGMYSALSNTAFGTEEKARVESDKWVTWFETNAPKVNYFWYIIDEPGEV